MHEIFLIVIQGVGEKGEGRTDFCQKNRRGGMFYFFVDQTNSHVEKK